jgi:hypothetical protein
LELVELYQPLKVTLAEMVVIVLFLDLDCLQLPLLVVGEALVLMPAAQPKMGDPAAAVLIQPVLLAQVLLVKVTVVVLAIQARLITVVVGAVADLRGTLQ